MVRSAPDRSALSRRRPTVIDLFSGVGGLALGFEQAGFDILASIEYDPVHAAVHKYNFPLTETLCRDARRMSGADILRAAGNGWRRFHPGDPWSGLVDVVVGGPSCQGFSVGGQRSALDERNELVAEFARLVVEIQPQAFCFENVPGFLMPQYRDLRTFAFGVLGKAGYRLTEIENIVNAADYGVPQFRRRVIIVGLRDATPSLPVPSEDAQHVVGDALAGLPSPHRYAELWSQDWVDIGSWKKHQDFHRVSTYAAILSGLLADPKDYSRPRQGNSTLLTNSRITRHESETVERFRATDPGKEEPVSRAFRLDALRPARTLRAGSGSERGAFTAPRPIHPSEPRVITVREAARLHSFPDWFRFNTTNWHGHRQVGNAVPPLLARAFARQLAHELLISPSRARKPVPLGEPVWLTMTGREAAHLLNATPSELPEGRRRKRPS